MDVENQVDNASAQSPIAKDQSKPRRSVSLAIVLVMALLALVLASIAVINFGPEFLRSHFTSNQDQQNFAELKANINQLQSRFDQLQNQQTQMLQTLTTTVKDLSAMMLSKRNPNRAWKLDEVAHLLRLAQYQLQFSHNPTRALELLNLVAQDIKKLNDPTLQVWQNEFAKLLEQLKAIPKVDTNQLLSQLEALKVQITTLPLKNAENETDAPAVKQQKTKLSWRQALNDSWNNIKNLVVIRRTDDPIQPLLAPGQRLFLEQNLRLLIQQAEWGVIDANAMLYRQSIKQLADYIKRYFDGNVASTQNLLQTLQQLSGINVEPKAPNLTPLITQLQQLAAIGSADKPQAE